MSPAWLTDPVNGDHFTGAGYGAAAVARYPSITVPMGEVHGLPVGIAFMGPAWGEARLIELAYAYEQASKARKPPTFAPTLAAAAPR
jgi:amidase